MHSHKTKEEIINLKDLAELLKSTYWDNKPGSQLIIKMRDALLAKDEEKEKEKEIEAESNANNEIEKIELLKKIICENPAGDYHPHVNMLCEAILKNDIDILNYLSSQINVATKKGIFSNLFSNKKNREAVNLGIDTRELYIKLLSSKIVQQKDTDEILRYAIENKDEALFKMVLKKQPNLLTPYTDNHLTPIEYAGQLGLTNFVTALAKRMGKSKESREIYKEVKIQALKSDNLDILKLMEKMGVYTSDHSREENTNSECELVAASGSINIFTYFCTSSHPHHLDQFQWRQHALIIAAKNGQWDFVHYLCSNYTFTTYLGLEYVSESAIKDGSSKALDWLEKYFHSNTLKDDMLKQLVEYGSVDTLGFLLKEVGKLSESSVIKKLIHIACEYGKEDILRKLLSHSYHKNVSFKYTSDSDKKKYESNIIYLTMSDNTIGCLKLLIDSHLIDNKFANDTFFAQLKLKCNVTALTEAMRHKLNFNWNQLMTYAIYKNVDAYISVMLDQGIALPLSLAAQYKKWHFLLRYEKSTISNADREHIVYYACYFNNMKIFDTFYRPNLKMQLTSLSKHESVLNFAINYNNLELVKSLIMKRPELLYNKSNCGNVLHHALINGNNEIFTYLMKQDKKLLYQLNNSNLTPLELAACRKESNLVLLMLREYDTREYKKEKMFCFLKLIEFFEGDKALTMLQKNHIHPSILNNHPKSSLSALHAALYNELDNLASALIQAGASITQVDYYGKTALDVAINAKKFDLASQMVICNPYPINTNSYYGEVLLTVLTSLSKSIDKNISASLTKLAKDLIDSGADFIISKESLPLLRLVLQNNQVQLYRIMKLHGLKTDQLTLDTLSYSEFIATKYPKFIWQIVDQQANNLQSFKEIFPFLVRAHNSEGNIFHSLPMEVFERIVAMSNPFCDDFKKSCDQVRDRYARVEFALGLQLSLILFVREYVPHFYPASQSNLGSTRLFAQQTNQIPVLVKQVMKMLSSPDAFSNEDILNHINACKDIDADIKKLLEKHNILEPKKSVEKEEEKEKEKEQSSYKM